ncbi:MAG: hypothetical protein ACK4GT_00360 [Pararhodobacter sp.]
MTYVIELRPSERILIDSAALGEVFKRLGSRRAEDFVMETVESISDTLAEVDAEIRTDDPLAAIAPRALYVSHLSEQIGLTSLARVARDLQNAALQADVVACRAVWDRLVRIGDGSLMLIWEQQGLSM